MSNNILELRNVSMRYAQGNIALNNITLALKSKEMVFLTGHSGAGKSTLLKIIAMLEEPTQGQIFFQNLNLKNVNDKLKSILRQKVGLILQDPLLLNRTVYDNVALPLIVAGMEQRHIDKKVRAALDKVFMLPKEKNYPAALSSGEKQRVSIARAIVNRPELILADEPTGNLDPDLSQEIFNLFARLNQFGVTMLVATHNIELIKKMPYKILKLEQGKLLDLAYTESAIC